MCPEPDGQELTDGQTAHDVMVLMTGECPWCGDEE